MPNLKLLPDIFMTSLKNQFQNLVINHPWFHWFISNAILHYSPHVSFLCSIPGGQSIITSDEFNPPGTDSKERPPTAKFDLCALLLLLHIFSQVVSWHISWMLFEIFCKPTSNNIKAVKIYIKLEFCNPRHFADDSKLS